ncbi:MAG: 4-hydroxybenzoate solanesyltransferase [Chroococcopsis gigantea SAG 12.99]|jgi:4-hydroxybenzoate polyprenyltransferase|nr:4-hydroxybenzoate solanesyltransferase [Chlorogloea purpurea SAG 13.99]MDV3001227.1 4-hydroxybenzoate solanesyltransferase [Chroococcopsis gigantea SAG 12.99]
MNLSDFKAEPLWLTVIRLLRWDKPAGRLILMIPALWGLFAAAKGLPPLTLVGVIVLGTLATSATGCVINDLWDRDIDPQVERTRNRPLANRAISIQIGLIIALIALVCAAVLAFYLNRLSFWLCVAAVPIIVVYPLAKRFFPIPQLVLSLAWGFAVLISWSAVTADLTPAAWCLWGAVVFWTLGFDTVYALSDREDDLKVGINSSAIFFGDRTAAAVGVFFALTTGLLAYFAVLSGLSWPFWIGLALSAIAWSRQYSRLLEPDLPRPVYNAIFANNVWIGFLILGSIILGSIY